VPGEEEDYGFGDDDGVLEQMVVAQDGDEATRHHANATRADERRGDGLHVNVLVQARYDERNARHDAGRVVEADDGFQCRFNGRGASLQGCALGYGDSSHERT